MDMKCIRCDTDNNLQERTDNRGLCKNCGHPFVFEPAIMKGMQLTDHFFANTIHDISADNTLYFTPKQLLYFLRKRPYQTINFWAITLETFSGISILFIGAIAFLKTSSPFIFVFIGIGLIINRLYGSKKTEDYRFHALSEEQLQKWLSSWLQVNDIPKLLSSASEEPSLTLVNSDISAYSFDRAVICDTDAIAKLLIANNFHVENNCAVLSITGYPQNIFNTVMQMLCRNPDLKVYALHDASPSGVALVHHLRTSLDWFASSNVRIYDLGILPRQAISKSNLFVQTSAQLAQQAKELPPAVSQSLLSSELKWLEKGKFLELESFSPQRILQILNQAITRSEDPNSRDTLVQINESGTYAYSSDSFG